MSVVWFLSPNLDLGEIKMLAYNEVEVTNVNPFASSKVEQGPNLYYNPETKIAEPEELENEKSKRLQELEEKNKRREEREKKYSEMDEYYKSKDPHCSINRVGRILYFGCYVPDGYSITGNGVFKQISKYNKNTKEYEEEWVNICSIRVMVTGRYRNLDGNHIVEITYIDKSEMKTIYAPLAAILGVKEFKETLRPQNLRIDDLQLKEMIPFFRKCIDENENEGGTAFKTGFCFDVTGWKDEACTKFNAGNRYFEEKNGVLTESKCIYTDENTATVFDPRGKIEDWVDGIKPLMQYDRVRFICYAGFSAVLLKYLKVDSFTIDLYGGIPGAENDKSSSGKTTTTEIALSGFGNVESGTNGTLFNTCFSTNNYIENLAAKYVDLPILLDESTLLADEDRDMLSYRTSSRVVKGRAKDGRGNNQKSQHKTNVALVTGENPLIQKDGNMGAKIRVIPIQGGVGVSNIGDLVYNAHKAAIENSGHLLKPFLEVFFKYRKYVTGWYISAHERLKQSTTNDMAKRQAAYFAAIETAGYLLELVFDKIGIEKRSPDEVVMNVWNDSVASHPTQPSWKEALKDTWDWYQENREIYFTPGESRKLFGWIYNDMPVCYLEINPKSLTEELLTKPPRKYHPDQTYMSWREAGIINVTGDKSTTKVVKRHGGSKRVIQINIKKLCEVLEIEDCTMDFW